MKKVIATYLLCALAAPSAAGAGTASSALTIIVPPNKAVVEGEMMDMVVKSEGTGADRLQIFVNNRRQQELAKPGGKNYVCSGGIPLSYGLNKVKVAALKNGKKVAEVSREVFYRSDLAQSAFSPPDGFNKYAFHTEAYENECLSCHRLDFEKMDTDALTGKSSPCYECHKGLLEKYSFVHGPSATWSCFSCHGSKPGSQKLATVHPTGKICADCHENAWDKKKFLHGPTAAGDCTTCHNPHASNNTYFLRIATGDLCTECHEEVLSKPHVLSGVTGRTEGHPVRSASNPFNPGHEFNCASCHNPHGSDSPVFLQDFAISMTMKDFCMSCHKMQ